MIKLKIKDIEWSFNVLQDEYYDAKNGKDSHGITHKSKLEVDFKQSSFSPPLVRHELLHAYTASCCINSIEDLDDHAMEEICAEIIEFHLEDLVKNSKLIYNKLNTIIKKQESAKAQKKDK